MIKKMLNSEKIDKPFSLYALMAFSLISLVVLAVILTMIYVCRLSVGQDVFGTLYSMMQAVPLGVGIALMLSTSIWATSSLYMSDDKTEDKVFNELCLSPENILKYELVETYGDFITLGVTFKDNKTKNFFKNLKAIKAYDSLKNAIDEKRSSGESYEADPHSVVIDMLIREFRDYASFRAKDVARGAETPHLAGLLIQKYGAGLMQALSVVYRSNRAADKLSLVIDQETLKIDPDYKANNKARWEMRPADVMAAR